jgi:uncharacterized protein (DUF924 family)
MLRRMSTLPSPQDVLAFWIGPLDPDGLAEPVRATRWFEKNQAFDDDCRARFEQAWHAAMAGDLEAWLDTPRGRLAYVVVLDQLARNMFRGTARQFQGDPRALGAAERGIELGHDRALIGDERAFLYMPFMHAESLPAQERGVALFTAFRDASRGPLRQRLETNLDFAVRHRDIIARGGRVPHRNNALDRTSTAAEVEFLQRPGSSF